MDSISIVMISLALSMDSLAVAVAISFSRDLGPKGAFKIGTFFGTFQAGMPILGWYGGVWLAVLISDFDHWIAFLLLASIGGKMAFEGITGSESDASRATLPLSSLLLLSLATSIDALAVGLSLSLLDVEIIFPAVVIGLVCFTLSSGGALLGKKLGANVGNGMRIVGGVILILIGLRILLDHLGIIG
ncbi:MAG: manganese efflux pump MntP family protein [Candidatus Methanosuratincola petrocarbonis]